MFVSMLILRVGNVAAVSLETLVMPGPVIEGHAEFESDCSDCHVAFSRNKQSALCLDCHEDVANDLQTGRGYHGLATAIKTETCAACHSDHKGRSADIINLDRTRFDHQFTDFGLSGAHVEADCQDCHADDVIYREAPSACFDCHTEDDQHDGNLGKECQSCHGTEDWVEVKFDHEVETGYALLGGHQQVTCTDCHAEQQYLDTPTDCYGCHRADDTHKGLNGSDCAFCHVSRSWTETIFDHAAETKFELFGQHGQIACADCHSDNNFDTAVDTECVACHRKDDEHQGDYGDDCGACHTENRWPEIKFLHDQDTDFPLLGLHRDTGCVDCHVTPMHQSNPATDCLSCHQSEDLHEGQLGELCGSCHNEHSWTAEVRFDHGLSVFPLIGGHADTECSGCHETPRFKDALGRCVDCHSADDTHKETLGSACGDCHNPVDWLFWDFEHNSRSEFELDGAHSDLACVACHKRPVKEAINLSHSCASCHRADDVHRGEFGDDCRRCHSTENFHSVERVGR